MKPNYFSMSAGAVLLTAALAPAGALAQDEPPDNSRLPSIEDVRPLSDLPDNSGIHNVRLNVDVGYARAEDYDQPTERDQRSIQTSIGLSADIGPYVFAGISGTLSDEDIRSTNLAFSMPMAVSGRTVGVNAVVGTRLLPFLNVGVTGGFGRGSASYQFLGVPAPATPGDSNTTRLGAFMTAFHAADRWLLTGTLSVLGTRTDQDYGAANIPRYDSYGSTLLMARAGAAYRLTDQWTIDGALTLNQVLSQGVASAQTGLDSSSFTLEGGLSYQVNNEVEIHARAATWLANDRTTFGRVALGLTYSF